MTTNQRGESRSLRWIRRAFQLTMAAVIGAVSLAARGDERITMLVGADEYLSQTLEGICVPAHSPKTWTNGWGDYDVISSKVAVGYFNTCELGLVLKRGYEWSSPRTMTGYWYVYTQAACPDGSIPSGYTCTPRPPVHACTVAYPVIPGTGTKILVENDSGSAELPLARAYRSFVTFGTNAGTGKWLFNWQRTLDTNIARFPTPQVSAWRDDGAIVYFQKNGATWTTPSTRDSLQSVADANGTTTTWLYTVAQNGTVETYDADGRLQSVRERNGRTTQLAYDAEKHLVSVTAPSGRKLTFAYDAKGRVASVTAPDGAVTQYAYDANGSLTTVTWPDNKTRQYVYENTRFPTALTGVIDEAGVRYTTYAYDDEGRAISSELTPISNRYQFQYQANGQTIVTQPSGTTSTYTFLKQNGVLLPTGVSVPCPTCGNTAQSTSYDANNNPTSKTGYDGSTTTYVYDALGRETQRLVGAGTADAKTTTTEWDPQQWLVTRVAAPNQIEAFSYDANGNLLSHTVTPTSDVNGSQGFAAAASGPIQRTDWTYDGSGHVLTTTERTDNEITGTWTFVYNAQGDLQSLTNPEGKAGRVVQYDAAGRVLEAMDVHGVRLKFRYNARGWLTDYEFDDQHIQYEYDVFGQPTAVLGPQNFVTRYVYDAAHRLIEVLDNITLPARDAQSSAVSPFGVAQSERAIPQTTPFQALRDMVVHSWNRAVEGLKQWLSGIVASAHAQVVVGGMTSYRPPLPIPMGQKPIKSSPYPEDEIDPSASSARRTANSAVARNVDACKTGDPCEEIQRQIRDIAGKLETKVRQQLADKWNLYENAYSVNPGGAIAGKGTWLGHDDQITGLKTGLARKVMEAKVLGCQVPPEVLRQIATLNPQRPAR
ncbi:RHS Repeat family protein [Ralstonia insidiosa]|uniref:RHS Repeat family protein n=1 Tax=Ralstonia insidiosa TaxID=190721 RepID=A0AAC9BMI6_9RALS|nr:MULTISPECIES: RHS repeat domain-containing protein [Ralstonia]ANH76616.1 RHS Repeat family protein [Ralstonia insidiosa]